MFPRTSRVDGGEFKRGLREFMRPHMQVTTEDRFAGITTISSDNPDRILRPTRMLKKVRHRDGSVQVVEDRIVAPWWDEMVKVRTVG